jgi:hypothetical protein
MKVIKLKDHFLLVDEDGNVVSEIKAPDEEKLKKAVAEAEERKKKAAQLKAYRDKNKN